VETGSLATDPMKLDFYKFGHHTFPFPQRSGSVDFGPRGCNTSVTFLVWAFFRINPQTEDVLRAANRIPSAYLKQTSRAWVAYSTVHQHNAMFSVFPQTYFHDKRTGNCRKYVIETYIFSLELDILSTIVVYQSTFSMLYRFLMNTRPRDTANRPEEY
jgi:hypothetical protein